MTRVTSSQVELFTEYTLLFYTLMAREYPSGVVPAKPTRPLISVSDGLIRSFANGLGTV